MSLCGLCGFPRPYFEISKSLQSSGHYNAGGQRPCAEDICKAVGSEYVSVKKKLLVRPIEHGTVIDHINAGQALNVMRIIGIARSTVSVVSIAMNVTSKQMGLKDIVKIEGKELNSKQVDKISLISPDATINIIRNYDVVSKYNVELPEEIIGIVRCNNPDCITNSDEPVASSFTVTKKPVILRCKYCDHIISEEIAEQLI